MARAGCFQPSSLPNSAMRSTPCGFSASAHLRTASRNTALDRSSGSAILGHWLPLPVQAHMRSHQRCAPVTSAFPRMPVFAKEARKAIVARVQSFEYRAKKT